MSDTVSVIIPSHDRAHLLGRALDSVLAQTRGADEIIVVDDGSTDATAELITRDYPDLRYIHQPQRGVSAARNRGIAEARGEWIALLDSDDEWRPEKLEQQLRTLHEQPETRLCHSDEIWIRNGRRVNPKRRHAKRGGEIYPHCLPLCVISPSASLIHRQVFGDHGLFDESLPACEDYDLWLRICAFEAVAYVDEPLLVKYGGHDDQLSQRYWGMDRFRIRALAGMLERAELNDNYREQTRAMLAEKIEVYLIGVRKRGRDEEVVEYEALRERYLG